MRMRLLVGVLVAGIVTGACASGGSSAAPASGTAAATPGGPRGSATMITEAEIAAANLETIYEVIERLRPNMLRTRGQMGRISGASGADPGASTSTIKVYLNGSPIGDLSALRSIQAASVKSVQYLNAADATTRFGTGVDAGAILITSK
ncbi:MAG: hypothetical protein ACREOG_16730 [Gemmatimonadaceae bacterium]